MRRVGRRVLGLASFGTKLVFRGVSCNARNFIPDLERLVDLPVGPRCRVPGFIPKKSRADSSFFPFFRVPTLRSGLKITKGHFRPLVPWGGTRGQLTPWSPHPFSQPKSFLSPPLDHFARYTPFHSISSLSSLSFSSLLHGCLRIQIVELQKKITGCR